MNCEKKRGKFVAIEATPGIASPVFGKIINNIREQMENGNRRATFVKGAYAQLRERMVAGYDVSDPAFEFREYIGFSRQHASLVLGIDEMLSSGEDVVSWGYSPTYALPIFKDWEKEKTHNLQIIRAPLWLIPDYSIILDSPGEVGLSDYRQRIIKHCFLMTADSSSEANTLLDASDEAYEEKLLNLVKRHLY